MLIIRSLIALLLVLLLLPVRVAAALATPRGETPDMFCLGTATAEEDEEEEEGGRERLRISEGLPVSPEREGMLEGMVAVVDCSRGLLSWARTAVTVLTAPPTGSRKVAANVTWGLASVGCGGTEQRAQDNIHYSAISNV